MVEQSIIERFWSKVDKSGDCWIWKMKTLSMNIGNETYTIKRLSYIIQHDGEYPSNWVYSICGNPRCVKHLTLERPAQSEETRDKISEWHTGRKLSDGAKRKISIANKGRVITDEARHNMSLAQIGKHKPWTDERRTAASTRLKEYYKDPENRKKLAHNKGRKLSYEWKKNCSRPGKQNGRYGISPPIESSRGKRTWYEGICFRSSYEARAAMAFDALGWEWTYEQERFDLGNETYLIDFKVNCSVFVEVKGWLNDDAKRKVEKFRSMYPYPLVVTGLPEIKRLEAGDGQWLLEGARG